MASLPTTHERLFFDYDSTPPDLDVRFCACRRHPGGDFFDIVDFGRRQIDRWWVAGPDTTNTTRRITAALRDEEFPYDPSTFLKDLSAPHVAQLSPDGKLLVSRGNLYNDTWFLFLDTDAAQAYAFPEDRDDVPHCYTCTGSFTPDFRYWFFVRWPLDEAIEAMKRRREVVCCEVGRLNLVTKTIEILYKLQTADQIHQITCSSTGRYLVFTSVKCIPNIPYPDATLEEDPEGYRRSHRGGIKKSSVVTVDLERGCHWWTQIPVPVPAHLEFDPIAPDVVYVSAHNFALSRRGTLMLEGPGAIVRLKIEDGRTTITGRYSHGEFLRVTQHAPFSYEGRTVIAVTNTPDRLELIDADGMTLRRRETLFHAELPDLSTTGNAVSPSHERTFFSVNPSHDGRWIVVESARCFHFYSVNEARFLEACVPRFLPQGCSGAGHTRLVGR